MTTFYTYLQLTPIKADAQSKGGAVLIVPLLIVDLKPDVYDAPALRLRSLTSTISSERRLDMPSTLHCLRLFGKYRVLLALADKKFRPNGF